MKRSVRRLGILCLIVLFIQGAMVRPCSSFTVGEEREVGEKLVFQVRKAFQVLDDPDIHQYINALGIEVLKVAGIQYFDYRFFVINNKEFNAFAAPSGLIFFHSGLLETMNSENELVSVMAHEIGHVVSRHLASRMDKGSKVSMATLALALASLALGDATATTAVMSSSLAAGQALNLHFSRRDEEEADLLAYGWMKDLKRDPHAQEEMLYTMRRITRYQMGQVPQYLLTHPNPEARLDYIQGLIAFEGTGKFDQIDEFDFVRMKYRVLSQVKDSDYLRKLFSSQIKEPQTDRFTQMMARYGLSLAMSKDGKFDSAFKLMEEVVGFFPEQSILLVDLGIIEAAMGRQDEAMAHFAAAYERRPDDMWAAFQMGRLHKIVGNYDRAEQLLEAVVRKIPEYSQAYHELGRIRSAKGDKPGADFYLGYSHLYAGMLKQAEQNFKQVVQNSKNSEKKEKAKEMLELIKRLDS